MDNGKKTGGGPVVSGDGGKRLPANFRFTTKKLAIFGIVVVILMIGLMVSQLFVAHETKTDTTKRTPVAASQALKDNGDYAGAAAAAASNYRAAAEDQKYLTAMEAATGYESNRDYENAITWYKTAAGLKQKDPGSAAGMARCYDALGKKADAVEYYQKTIDWYERTDIAVSNDIPMYEKLRDKAKESL